MQILRGSGACVLFAEWKLTVFVQGQAVSHGVKVDTTSIEPTGSNVRVSDELHDHRSSAGNTTFTSACYGHYRKGRAGYDLQDRVISVY